LYPCDDQIAIVVLVACFAEAASFGLGTLVATTSHILSPILLGIAVFAALIAWASTKWAAVGTFTAIIFAIGVGLPGYSIQSAGLRTLFSLIGMLWALLGIEIQRFVLSHRIQQLSESESAASEQQQQQQQPPTPRLAALRSALMIGIASAVGYTIGLVLGLPRDFWIIITIIVAVRPNGSLTIIFTSMMIIGTIAGALIAGVVLHETTNLYLLLVLLFSFAVMVFATARVNVILTQIFLVPFIIILLNIYYPGEWYLSFIRILDVAIGGAIAVAMVYLSGSRLTLSQHQ
jgi:Fusaric acid resistance protein-like